jgi:hypothetical protein
VPEGALMTRGETSQLSRDVMKLTERQAVTETKLDALIERAAAQDEKFDLVLKGLSDLKMAAVNADQDRKAMAAKLQTMQPHVETVANWKTFWKIAAWVSATVCSILAAIWGAWTFLVEYITWK